MTIEPARIVALLQFGDKIADSPDKVESEIRKRHLTRQIVFGVRYARSLLQISSIHPTPIARSSCA